MITYQFIFNCVNVILWSILLHELGHFFFLRCLQKNVELRFYFKNLRNYGFKVGDFTDYLTLSNKQRLTIYIGGITAGLIPYLIVGQYSPYYYLLLGFYALGSYPDIKKSIKTIKQIQQQNGKINST